MEIKTDTPSLLTVFFPRRISGYFAAAICCTFGFGFIALATGLGPDTYRGILFLIGTVFAGSGILIATTLSSATVTLDAKTESASIKWTPLIGPKSKTVPLADITRIAFHSNEGSESVKFILTDQREVFLEQGFSGNRKAAPMANRMEAWLRAHRGAAP